MLESGSFAFDIMKIRKLIKEKKALEFETLVLIIVAVVILIVLIGGYVILRQKDISALEFIKNLFRFRR